MLTLQEKPKRSWFSRQQAFIACAVLVFGVIGSILLVSTHAATQTASLQADSGTITQPAIQVTDTTASGGTALKFMAASTTTQTKNCQPVPSACGFPDATNTGVPAGTTLTNSGNLTITAANSTVSGLNITGCVTIKANNVTFKNSIIHGGNCDPAISVPSNITGATISHVEIDGQSSSNGGKGFYGWNTLLDYVNIHNTVADAVDIESGDTITNSYIHDQVYINGVSPHLDAIQATDGSNMTMRHNSVFNLGNGAAQGFIIGADLGDLTNITIDNNLVAAAGTFINAGHDTGYKSTTYTFTNNRFGVGNGAKCEFSPDIINFTFTGNVVDATDAPLSYTPGSTVCR